MTTLRIFSKKKYLQVTEKWNRDGVNYHWYIQHIIESFKLSRFSNAKPIIINFYKLHVSNNEKRHKKDEGNLTHLSWNWEMYCLLLPITVFVLPIMWNFLENWLEQQQQKKSSKNIFFVLQLSTCNASRLPTHDALTSRPQKQALKILAIWNILSLNNGNLNSSKFTYTSQSIFKLPHLRLVDIFAKLEAETESC